MVFVEESAESVASVDAEPCEGRRLGDRVGQRPQGPCVGDAPVRPVSVVVAFVLANGVQQMDLVEDQSPVE